MKISSNNISGSIAKEGEAERHIKFTPSKTTSILISSLDLARSAGGPLVELSSRIIVISFIKQLISEFV